MNISSFLWPFWEERVMASWACVDTHTYSGKQCKCGHTCHFCRPAAMQNACWGASPNPALWDKMSQRISCGTAPIGLVPYGGDAADFNLKSMIEKMAITQNPKPVCDGHLFPKNV